MTASSVYPPTEFGSTATAWRASGVSWTTTGALVSSKLPREASVFMKATREQPAPDRATRSATTTTSGRRIADPLFGQVLAERGLSPGPVEHLPLQLAARRVDVVAAGAPHRRQHARFLQGFLERADVLFRRALKARARERIERNEVDLRRVLHLHGVVELVHQARQLLCMLRLVVDALHQRVLEGDRRALLAHRIARGGVEELG